MGLAASVATRSMAPLRVRSGNNEWVTGEGEPGATLEAPLFELFRALSGRRSADQIRGYDWSGDREPYIPAFEYGPFTVSPTDVEE